MCGVFWKTFPNQPAPNYTCTASGCQVDDVGDDVESALYAASVCETSGEKFYKLTRMPFVIAHALWESHSLSCPIPHCQNLA